MKRIDCRGSAIEACATKQGTIVGPLMTELVGFKELTPYRGGWCGNEIFDGAFAARRPGQQARDLTFKFGEQLRKEGYRGYFELDFLIDKKTGEIWLGELNPRITGASSMTNHAAFAHADAPLFLFHLLEFSDMPFDLDVEELNGRWADPEMIDCWSQMVIKHTDDTVDIITDAPRVRHLPDGSPTGGWPSTASTITAARWRARTRPSSCASCSPGDYRYEGADLGILVTRGRSMTKDFQLTSEPKRWIDGIKPASRRGRCRPQPGPAVADPAFKIM